MRDGVIGLKSKTMRYYRVCVLFVAIGSSGCQSVFNREPTEYRTLTADPHHDTEEAKKQHQKALRIIERHQECVACRAACEESAVVSLHGIVDCSAKCHDSDLADAQEHVQKALVADVTFGPAHNTLGTLYMWQGRYYLAAWEFEYANRLMPERCEPLYNLGMVYEAVERLDQAISYYSLAHECAPQNPAVLGNLIRAQLRNGQTIDEVRPLLSDLILYDTRPDWVSWAREQLGLNPGVTVAGPFDISVPPLPAAHNSNGAQRPEKSQPVPETLAQLPRPKKLNSRSGPDSKPLDRRPPKPVSAPAKVQESGPTLALPDIERRW